MRKTHYLLTAAIFGISAASAAQAQTDSSVLISPAIPEGYDRGRNVSVTERPRPDYDQLGIRQGSFLIFPKVTLGAGFTSNPFLVSDNAKASAIASVAPSVSVNSDWDRDLVRLSASGLFNRYLGNSTRNETQFDLKSLGRKDIGAAYTVTGEAQFGKFYESPTSGAIDPALSVLSSYYRGYLSARGQYTVGKARAVVAVDRTSFAFNDLTRTSGVRIDQGNRDRIIARVTGELQYAFTPSASVYGQATYGTIDYSEPLAPGVANRDSTGWRVIGGLNFDLSGLMRGQVGVGYIQRNYRSATFRDVGGFSTEAQLQFFPSELTTVTVSGGRTLEDAGVFNSSAYFDNRLGARVDHELLRNLLLGASGEYRRQNYVDSDIHNNYFRTAANARYLSSRFLVLGADLGYIRRSGSGSSFNEVRGMVSVTLQR